MNSPQRPWSVVLFSTPSGIIWRFRRFRFQFVTSVQSNTQEAKKPRGKVDLALGSYTGSVLSILGVMCSGRLKKTSWNCQCEKKQTAWNPKVLSQSVRWLIDTRGCLFLGTASPSTKQKWKSTWPFAQRFPGGFHLRSSLVRGYLSSRRVCRARSISQRRGNLARLSSPRSLLAWSTRLNLVRHGCIVSVRGGDMRMEISSRFFAPHCQSWITTSTNL